MTREAGPIAKKEAAAIKSQCQQAHPAMATHKACKTAEAAHKATEGADNAKAFAKDAASPVRNAGTAAVHTHALGAAQAYNRVGFSSRH